MIMVQEPESLTMRPAIYALRRQLILDATDRYRNNWLFHYHHFL